MPRSIRDILAELCIGQLTVDNAEKLLDEHMAAAIRGTLRQSAPPNPHERIATALERIADLLAKASQEVQR